MFQPVAEDRDFHVKIGMATGQKGGGAAGKGGFQIIQQRLIIGAGLRAAVLGVKIGEFHRRITRAQQTLSISYTKTRRRFGKIEECTPSRFLDELPKEDLRFDGAADSGEENRSKGKSTLAHLKGLLKAD